MWARGLVFAYLGDHNEALRCHQKAMRIDPHFADGLREPLVDAHYMARRYDEAIALFRGWLNPPWHMYSDLAAAHAQLDQMDEAREACEHYYRSLPEGHDSARGLRYHVDMCARQEDRDHWIEGYRKAGFAM